MIHTLTRHERLLLILYRTANVATRGRIDGELFEDWTHRPCSLDPAALESLRFRLAVEQIHQEHLMPALPRFAAFWSDEKGGA